MQDLKSFFAPNHFIELQPHGTYQPLQWGANVHYATQDSFNWDDADIVIVGCGECRGENGDLWYNDAPDKIREELYRFYNWHSNVRVADAGNILQGATVVDTRAALTTVVNELQQAGKIVIILGGSHDLTLSQYEAFKKSDRLVNAVVADMLVDLNESEWISSESFLMNMLTEQPNFVKAYSHIGFQSYYVHPRMLETLDKLRFDCFRLGRVRENMEHVEPVFRSSDMFSMDINVVRYSDAPANTAGSPNGFTGEEACILTRYAGMSSQLTSLGIYGYNPVLDQHNMTARLIAQMLWYFIDGYLVRKSEAELSNGDEFVEYHVTFTTSDTIFIKSKRTNRWWMQLPNNMFVPCSYDDYLEASSNQIPERWLREQERLV
jgi:formiminoglutamase